MRFHTPSHIALLIVATVATTLGAVDAADAFTFRVENGVADKDGSTNKGAFSKYQNMSTMRTIDFNSGSVPTSGPLRYSFANTIGTSSVRADNAAPAGPNGEVNVSKYLAVFNNQPVEIWSDVKLNSFGFDWGAISVGNVISFYRDNDLIKSINPFDVNPIAPVRPAHHGGEGDGYVYIDADNPSESFNRIVLSQTVLGSGFETDNHSFNVGDGAFIPEPTPGTAVPEPGTILGLAAIALNYIRTKNV
jgi:hypothetical protein